MQVTRVGFSSYKSALSNQPFLVGLFTQCNAHCLEVGVDPAWVDDTGLYLSIPWFPRIGGLGVHKDSHEVVELLHWFTSLRNMPLGGARDALRPTGTEDSTSG